MNRVLIGISCFIVSIGFSQTIGKYDLSSNMLIDLGSRSSAAAINVQGSQYFNETYLPSKVSGYENETIPLRYNAAQDEMEFQKAGQLYHIPKTQNMTVTHITNQKVYEYIDYIDKEDKVSGYLAVLHKGEQHSLYKREQIKYIPAKEASNSYDRDRPAQYKKADDTYFIKTGDVIENFPKNRKELLRKFSNKKTQLSDFIKKNKISFSQEGDLIKLVIFLNTL
ncbi:MAG: hypothetical protein AB7D46_07655 [Flavobacteriaceae bacterium]